MTSLRSDLAHYDGRHTDVLERIAASLRDDARAIQRLVDIASGSPRDRVAVAATWVLLRLCEDHGSFSLDAPTITRLRAVLTATDHWETRLHILQALANVDLAAVLTRTQRESLVAAARVTADDDKPFVRAWSLNLLGLLGGLVSTRQGAEIARLIAAADRNGPASIRARLRRLRKVGGLDWMDAIERHNA
ncbi:MAG: hypothetical protein KF787_13420 [Phycisphaeraceae bacterium]|nr:hypothetical protein [Phycisphaerae bacterium]MBX3393634.1 hypothetical protein [Phycisphaeraceae bacterium]HRJ50012.1 hypothetical protein [Phycisphaerales bacterium]